jgi:thiamine-monophosphate kinase
VTTTRLGPGREFDAIRRILADAPAPGPGVALAAGDDCALIRPESGNVYLAVTSDMAVEGVHFRSEWGSPEEIGGRAVRAAASDLAAMAAEPIGVLASIAVPSDDGAELAERVGRGCRTAAETLGLDLLGGDLAGGAQALTVDVTAIGRARDPLLRAGARPGDELWVTGRLGGAAAAVAAWLAGREPEAAWRERFWRPVPRLAPARWLAERGASAAIDLSDGLAADAGHLAAASGVGIELDLGDVPAAEGVELLRALTGGEDYELLVAAAPDILADEAAGFRARFDLDLTRVGRAVVGAGVRVYRDDEEVEVGRPGFDHFEGEGDGAESKEGVR